MTFAICASSVRPLAKVKKNSGAGIQPFLLPALRHIDEKKKNSSRFDVMCVWVLLDDVITISLGEAFSVVALGLGRSHRRGDNLVG